MEEETVGTRLVRLAAAHPEMASLTREALATQVFEVTYESLRKWIAGKAAPSRNRAAKIALKLGVPAETFMHGVRYLETDAEGSPLVREVSSSAYISTPAQSVSQSSVTVTPRSRLPQIEWRDKKMTEAYERFTVVAPDDSMAPVILKGGLAVFDRTLLPARNGDIVLVEDEAGDWYIRTYLHAPGGHWEAIPEHDKALSLEAKKHGLTVLAIFDGTVGRRG